jgi:hypothetical protein
MTALIRPIDPPGPPWPKVEFTSYRPVPDLTMLAAVERAGRHTRHPDKRTVARLLGFRFSGAASRSIQKQLERLEAAGLVARKPGRHGREDWLLTDPGRDGLQSRRGDIEPLPESPEHRRWRHCRALAGDQLDDAAAKALEALGGVEATIRRRAAGDLTATDVAFIQRLLEWRLRRLGVVLYCLRDWPEPDDDVADRSERPLASLLLSFSGSLAMLNATEQDEAEHMIHRFEVDR